MVEEMPVSRDPLAGRELLSQLALVYAWLGDRDKAFEQLFVISQLSGSPSYGDLKLNPIWDPLRDDPRFNQLLAEAARPIAIE